MKKSTIIIFVVLAMLKTQAQDYLISFASSGDTANISTVKVDNLTSGATVTINGGDLLHLIPASGIGSLDINNGMVQINPNPMTERSILTFVAPESGSATIYIVDLSGKTVCQSSKLLSPGAHSFRVSGINQGMYFVKVAGKNYNYSAKLISQSSLECEARIEYVSSETNSTKNNTKSTATTINMPYTDGNILMYKGVAGQYSTVVTDVPSNSKTTTFNFVTCTDSDGNNYTTVQTAIGTSSAQTWMAENLKVGVRINVSQSQTNNGIIEHFCYDDIDNNCFIYGGLYQWNEMMQYVDTVGVIKGICPDGWHIPTIDEWGTLIAYIGGIEVAGSKLKEKGNAHWLSPNNDATNECGFTALPGGWFDSVFANGFSDIGAHACFWTSLSKSGMFIDYYYLELHSNYIFVYTLQDPPRWDGYSVRCLAD